MKSQIRFVGGLRNLAVLSTMLLFPTICQAISLSTDVLNEGNPAGLFYGNSYNNNGTNSTVELVRFIPNSDSSPLNVDYRQSGATIDLAAYVLTGGTGGTLGSNIHGRNSTLYLPGDGETIALNNGGIGIGAHANWLITFDLDDIRTVHLGGTTLPLQLTGRFGMNGSGAGNGEIVDNVGAVQGLIYLDGVQIDASTLQSRPDPSYAVSELISSGRYLTFAIVNGNNSTFFDDGTFRDLNVVAVPEPSSLVMLAFGSAFFWFLKGRRSS